MESRKQREKKASTLSKITIGSLVTISFVSIFNMLYNLSQTDEINTSSLPTYSNDSTIIESINETNYKALKRRAIDSLIDNKALSVENLQMIDSLYPDSLCKCQ